MVESPGRNVLFLDSAGCGWWWTVEGFLSTLASSPGIAAWKVEQATDALTILLGCVFGQEWARTIPVPGQTRSRIIAIPWPTPMHMVPKA